MPELTQLAQLERLHHHLALHFNSQSGDYKRSYIAISYIAILLYCYILSHLAQLERLHHHLASHFNSQSGDLDPSSKQTTRS